MSVSVDQQRVEALGPAETVLNTLTQFMDHAVHNRPGMVSPSTTSGPVGVTWQPVTWKIEQTIPGVESSAVKNVYSLNKTTVGGKSKTTKTLIGTLRDDGKIIATRDRNPTDRIIGEYRKPGLFPEVVSWMYRQVANVWKMDNEFAARWASWAFGKEHRDLKVVLAAFLLVQSRSGEPVIEGGEVIFHDEDFRAVGEAMCLIKAKDGISPKLLLRIGEVLSLPEIAEINRELGFGKSARNPAMGRYLKAVEKWLRYREQNPKLLAGLVKEGFRTTVMELASKVHYKPLTDEFYKALRWKQKQAKDGRRTMALNAEVSAAESWEGLTETQICEKISKEKPNYKRIVGLLPKSVGLTRAILACAIESGCLSNADLIILTPTLEEFGLLQVASVMDKWKKACDTATNQRAANIAKNVKTKEAREGLQDAADKAMVNAVEEVTRDLRVYLTVDISSSMGMALERAVSCLTQFLGGFPLDRLHVSVFNTEGREVEIKAPKAAAVQHAFASFKAGGGTSYAQGVRVLAKHAPKAGEDSIIWFIGDQEDYNVTALVSAVRNSGIAPVGFGLLHISAGGQYSHGNGTVVVDAARQLGIPCFTMDEAMFKDVYAVPRTIRNLIASTPVGASASPVRQARKSLVREILETPLLEMPLPFQVKAA